MYLLVFFVFLFMAADVLLVIVVVMLVYTCGLSEESVLICVPQCCKYRRQSAFCWTHNVITLVRNPRHLLLNVSQLKMFTSAHISKHIPRCRCVYQDVCNR